MKERAMDVLWEHIDPLVDDAFLVVNNTRTESYAQRCADLEGCDAILRTSVTNGVKVLESVREIVDVAKHARATRNAKLPP